MKRWFLVITKFDYWRARQQIGWGLLAHAPRHTGPAFDSVSIAVLLCFAEVQCSAAECARHSVFALEASSLVFYLIFAIQHLYELTGMLLPSSTVENVARSSYSLPDEKWTHATAAKWERSGCCSKTWFEKILQETAISYLSVKPWFSVDFGSDPLICWRTILYAGANCLFMQSKAGNLAVHGWLNHSLTESTS